MGNNPYGSKGCHSCATCRKRKGFCEYKNEEEPCFWCLEHRVQCTPKYTKTEYNRLTSGRSREVRLSSIALKIEQENPDMDPFDVAAMAVRRLEAIVGSKNNKRGYL